MVIMIMMAVIMIMKNIIFCRNLSVLLSFSSTLMVSRSFLRHTVGLI
jgi:hypothetical protein